MSIAPGRPSLGISSLQVPGLFITGTDTDVGKTIVAGAIADWFRRRGRRAGVSKPVGSGCVRRREGLVSEDAEWLAHCADSPHPLDLICPQRYVEPLAPAVAAERSRQPLDWTEVERSLQLMSRDSEVMIVEGVGGVMVPLDAKHTVLDLAVAIGLPAIVVARPALGTINHTLLTLHALRQVGVPVAGVVINRYPAENTTVAEETNPRAIEKWGRVKVLCIVPEERLMADARLGPEIVAAVETVDWSRLAKPASR
jgi:dethiobiotin synthetase